MIGRAVVTLVALALVVVLGLGVVPALISSSGVLVYPGSTFSYRSSDFLDIPFSVDHGLRLSGSFQSSSPVYLYVLDSDQFEAFDRNGGGGCPILGFSPILVNVTEASIASSVDPGSYSIVFCNNFQPPNVEDVQVRITSPIGLSP